MTDRHNFPDDADIKDGEDVQPDGEVEVDVEEIEITDVSGGHECDCQPKEQCRCGKCRCARCSSVGDDECACCKHECRCCGHDEFIESCGCEGDCQCADKHCECGHGPCACGCRGGVREPGCKCECHGECKCGKERRGHDHKHGRGGRKHGHGHGRGGRKHGHGDGHRHGHGEGAGKRPPFHLSTKGKVALAIVGGVDVTLRAFAITKALRRGDKNWILPLALVSSAGILPTVYLLQSGDADK